MSEEIESKHQKFLRLSERRAERAVHHVLLLRNLASTDYENTPEEAEELIARLQEPVDEVALAFGIDRADTATPELVSDEQADTDMETDDAVAPAPAVAPTSPSQSIDPSDPAPLLDGSAKPEFPHGKEGMELIRVGPWIGAAYEALNDGNADQAKKILFELLRA